MKRQLIVLSLAVTALNACGQNQAETPLPRPAADTTLSYTGYLSQLNQQRLALQKLHDTHPDSALKETGKLLHSAVVDGLYPYWQGTPWEFYGSSQTPGQGSIACGYFVTTLLLHCGAKLDRVALAEDYSENMIKKLVQAKHINHFVPFDLEKFISSIQQRGDGLYVIGMDNHTGFISCRGGQVSFIHSSVVTGQVSMEAAAESYALQVNHYGVTGCLTADRRFLLSWLSR